MSDYKRNARRDKPAATPKPRRPPASLTTEQQLAVAQRRALVHEHLPDAVPFISELAKLGMIDGWRNVVSVTTPDGVTYGNPDR